MSKVSTLSKLFHAIAAQDWAAAQQLALRMADDEAARGNHVAATRLRGALKPNGHRVTPADNVGANAQPAAIGILSQLPANDGLDAVALPAAHRTQLDELVTEWRRRATLQKHGLRHRNKVLLHPPGCGKSMTARALLVPAYYGHVR